MRGRSPANGNPPRPAAGVRDGEESGAAVSPEKPDTGTAGELRPVTAGKTDCGDKLRVCAMRSCEVCMRAGAAHSATNPAAGGKSSGSTGGAATGAASTGGASGARRCLFCIRKSSARASCFFLYAFSWASEQNSACCSLRNIPIFFPQKAHSIRHFNRLKRGAGAAAEHLGCGVRNTLTGFVGT